MFKSFFGRNLKTSFGNFRVVIAAPAIQSTSLIFKRSSLAQVTSNVMAPSRSFLMKSVVKAVVGVALTVLPPAVLAADANTMRSIEAGHSFRATNIIKTNVHKAVCRFENQRVHHMEVVKLHSTTALASMGHVKSCQFMSSTHVVKESVVRQAVGGSFWFNYKPEISIMPIFPLSSTSLFGSVFSTASMFAKSMSHPIV